MSHDRQAGRQRIVAAVERAICDSIERWNGYQVDPEAAHMAAIEVIHQCRNESTSLETDFDLDDEMWAS